jgi:acetyltransferase-like isoleucine patch superfamily enzyme
MPNAVLTHDVVAEDFVSVCASVSVGGAARVRTGTYLGQGCTIREGLTLGAWSMVGMGAAVVHEIGDCQLWAGVPARLLGASEGPVPPRAGLARTGREGPARPVPGTAPTAVRPRTA